MRGLSMAATTLFRTPHTGPALESSTVQYKPYTRTLLAPDMLRCAWHRLLPAAAPVTLATTTLTQPAANKPPSPSAAGHWGWEQACFHVYLHEQVCCYPSALEFWPRGFAPLHVILHT